MAVKAQVRGWIERVFGTRPELGAGVTERKRGRQRCTTGPYAVLYALGLRLGEVLGLCWSDVDLVKGELTVNHSMRHAAAN